jgi:hypothetical protein
MHGANFDEAVVGADLKAGRFCIVKASSSIGVDKGISLLSGHAYGFLRKNIPSTSFFSNTTGGE